MLKLRGQEVIEKLRLIGSIELFLREARRILKCGSGHFVTVQLGLDSADSKPFQERIEFVAKMPSADTMNGFLYAMLKQMDLKSVSLSFSSSILTVLRLSIPKASSPSSPSFRNITILPYILTCAS